VHQGKGLGAQVTISARRIIEAHLEVMNPESIDLLDETLLRASVRFYEELSDEADTELNILLPALIEAGYVEEEPWGDDPDHFLWSFTDVGVKRRKELEALNGSSD
jgi:hypothetical protein